MRGRLVVTVLVVVVALVAGVVPSGAGITSQDADTTYIRDGDTFEADLVGGDDIAVRLIGVNTLETGRDPCWWDEDAEKEMKRLIPEGTRVVLSAKNLNTMSGSRYARWVDRKSDGLDVALHLLKKGLALASPHTKEDTRNRTYLLAAAEAAAARVGLWGGERCGAGPGGTFGLWVNWDADGRDGTNYNGEYVRIRNYSYSDVSLAGWWVRDAGTMHYYYFPKGAKIAARRYVTVYLGTGTNTATKFYAGWNQFLFQNANAAKTRGDGAFLFDPDGDLRARMMYPCMLNCKTRLDGKIRLSVRYDAAGSDDDNPNGEYVRIKNISTRNVYMNGFQLESYPYIYDFYRPRLSSRIGPGEVMIVRIGKGKSSRLRRYWGKSSGILGNTGDSVKVRSFDDITVVCKYWGSGSCAG